MKSPPLLLSTPLYVSLLSWHLQTTSYMMMMMMMMMMMTVFICGVVCDNTCVCLCMFVCIHMYVCVYVNVCVTHLRGPPSA